MTCAVSCCVHCVDRQDRAGQVGEHFQQFAHRGDLVRLLLQTLVASADRFSRWRHRRSHRRLQARYGVTSRPVGLQDFGEQSQMQPDTSLVLRASNRPDVTGESAKDRKIFIRILGQDDQRHSPAESDSRLQKDRGWRRRRCPIGSRGRQHCHRETELIQRHRSELRPYQQLRRSRGGDTQLGEHRPQRRQVGVARRNYKALRHERRSYCVSHDGGHASKLYGLVRLWRIPDLFKLSSNL
jgi:hypothetical protein